MSLKYKVEIITSGRHGSIQYLEARGSAQFEWEFGTGDVVATVTVPAGPEFDRLYPWATGRRDEILERVLSEVVSLKVPGGRVEFDSHSPFASILKP